MCPSPSPAPGRAPPHAPLAEESLAEVLAEVRRIQAQARRLVREAMSGGYASAFRGAGLAFESVREYAEGDDPRAVDWNVTARMGRPFVKTYVEERERTLLFLVDRSASMDGGTGLWSPRGAAARVLACLALAAVRAGDRVGLCSFGAGSTTWVAPGRGLAHALRLVRDVLALPSEAGPADPAPALDLATRLERRHGVVLLLSDLLGSPLGASTGSAAGSATGSTAASASARCEAALRRCARRHDTVAVHLQDPALAPPAVGLVRVHDPEGGPARLLDLGSPRVRAAHAARVAAWRARLAATLSRAHADLLELPIPAAPRADALSGPLQAFFRRREARRAAHR
ncbi:MAG: DUF58 domain-containing protein [Planctomycetia bacterium]